MPEKSSAKTEAGHYEIDIAYIEIFANDFCEIKTPFEVLSFPNGCFEVKFEVNEKTTKWMNENYNTNEEIEFFIKYLS